VVVAQQLATLETLFPGRAFLGAGSSEAMDEVPAGLHRRAVREQPARTEEALQSITRLLDGETADFAGRFLRTHGARLYLRPERRPPLYGEHVLPELRGRAGAVTGTSRGSGSRARRRGTRRRSART
jgi:coenzyme F420-dependent glucose-6-phosphate dehydrogenase